MEKIIALLLALVSVLMCFASCSNTPDTIKTSNPSTNNPNYVPPTSMEEKFIQSDLSVVYNGFYYYTGKTESGTLGSPSTIKVQNLKKLLPEGVQLYSDPLGNEDPFLTKYPKYEIIVDEEATQKNGGMPVLLISMDYESDELDDNTVIWKYKIVSYNTANGIMKTIIDDVEQLQKFYLYNGQIYCVSRTWDKKTENTEDPKRIYHVLVMDKDGSNKKEYMLEEKNVCPMLLGVYKGKLYFTQNHNILSSDLDFNNSKIIINDIECNFTPVFAGGYMYYMGNYRDIEVDSYIVKNCHDLLRRPLDNILDKCFEEVVLEKIYDFFGCQQSNLYVYKTINDTQIIEKNSRKWISGACTHIFDINTGKSELLFDFRQGNSNTTFNTIFASDDLFIYTNSGKTLAVYRLTGIKQNIDFWE